MPTLPSGSMDPEEIKPHQARDIAESFGSAAERYDRTRPSYPEAMVQRIVDTSPGPELVDAGCGTGIEVRQFEAAGCKVLGVEPDVRMAEFAQQRGIDVELAKFEEWDAAGRIFDAVVSGQAWHWVDPVAGARKAAQVLRPGGRIAVFWNAFITPQALAEGSVEVYRRVLPELPIFHQIRPGIGAYEVMCDTAADGIRESGAFDEPERWQFDWERFYTKEEWLDQVPTFGGHNRLPAEKLAELLDGIGSVIDKAGGGFTMPYAAVVVTASRISG